jgi:nucleoside-diphosphate-sugar epimerase
MNGNETSTHTTNARADDGSQAPSHRVDQVHLVTGGTGFVGAALVLELLQVPGQEVVALVRPRGGASATERLHGAIRAAAVAYGVDPDAVPLERSRAIAGDVTAPGCGVAEAPRATMLWHSAASLRYEDRFADEIRATNVDGTRHVLELAAAAGVEVANMFSTAYVAGAADGRILEAAVVSPAPNNAYEQSKIDAEALVRAAGDRMLVRTFRPSIVVGHSRTLAATAFTGMYGFIRQMVQLRGAMDRLQKGFLAERSLRLRADPGSRIDLVPVDAVAAQAVHIGLAPGSEGVYHLTQDDSPTVGDTICAITDALGFARPEFVGPGAELDWLDQQLAARMDFYGSYIRGDKVFDRRRADAALAGAGTAARPALPSSPALTGWYLERLAAERAALPVSR